MHVPEFASPAACQITNNTIYELCSTNYDYDLRPVLDELRLRPTTEYDCFPILLFEYNVSGGPPQWPSEGKLQPSDPVKTDPKIHRFSKSIFWVLPRGPWRIRLAKVMTLSAKMKHFSKNRRRYCILAPSDPPGAPNGASLGLQDRLLAPMQNKRFASDIPHFSPLGLPLDPSK